MRPLLPTALAAAALAAPAAAQAAPLAGVDTANRLVTFDSARPGTTKAVALRGLGAGERVEGLDRRPATGALVAVTSAGRLYAVTTAGQATPIGSAPFAALDGRSFGFDVNPMVDRLRLVSDFAQNLRLHPDTGALAATDGKLGYVAGDENAARPPAVVASAYTNNVPMAMSTQLFGIDARTDELVLQDPPNAGGLKTVGPLARDVVSPVAFDIAGASTSYVAFRMPQRTGSFLAGVDLAGGRLTTPRRIGTAKRPVTLRGLTALAG